MEVEAYILFPQSFMIGFSYHNTPTIMFAENKKFEIFLGIIAISITW
jgi:hypothetical protein